MSTAAQINANRANATRSTGPRTLEGKATAGQNATRHGLRAALSLRVEEALLHDDHDRELLYGLRDDLHARYNPQSVAEELAIERMLVSTWRQRRLSAMDSALYVALDDPEHPLDMNSFLTQLSKLARYENTLRRSYDHAKAELEQLRAERPLRASSGYRRPVQPQQAHPPAPPPPAPRSSPAPNKANPPVVPKPLDIPQPSPWSDPFGLMGNQATPGELAVAALLKAERRPRR